MNTKKLWYVTIFVSAALNLLMSLMGRFSEKFMTVPVFEIRGILILIFIFAIVGLYWKPKGENIK